MSPTPLLDHVKNFVWLRWRIQSNQLSRSSSIGKVIAALMLVSFCFAILASFGLGTLLGAFLPSQFPREYYFLIWDGVILCVCMIWLIYLIVDIQRTDTITLDRILHLPVSFAQVFAVNYLCSLLSFQPLCLLAGGLGFILGSMVSVGPTAILFVFPFLAFFLVLTALSYHLQGWISTLMSNPRRRRAILIGLPFCIVLLTQIPALVMSRFAGNDSRAKPTVLLPQEAKADTVPVDTPDTAPIDTPDTAPIDTPDTAPIDTQIQLLSTHQIKRKWQAKAVRVTTA